MTYKLEFLPSAGKEWDKLGRYVETVTKSNTPVQTRFYLPAHLPPPIREIVSKLDAFGFIDHIDS